MDQTRIIRVVADNVLRARATLSISQEELAAAAEVDRTYVSQVERAKRNITIVVLARLAEALRTTPEALVAAGEDGTGVVASRPRKRGKKAVTS